MGNKHGTPTPSAQGRQNSAYEREKPSIYPSASAAEGRTYDYLYKVVLSGDACTGKTSVLLRLARESFYTGYIPTIGLDFRLYSVILDEIRYKLQVWEQAGQERFRTLTRGYYRGIQGVIIFYDASSQNTFDNVPYWIKEARKYAHPDATLMLMGTKCDCSEKKVVTYETAKEFAEENDILFFEVSAKYETNIEFAVSTLVAEIRRIHCEYHSYSTL